MQHPKTSLNLLKEKKVTITPIVAEIIEKHHERVDGKGFPGQLPGHKIPPEAQLLAYADAFEYLTRAKPGMPALKPTEAHGVIIKELAISPEILRKVEGFINNVNTAA
jgi:HD-GYP domain-containing protein (c-di-GMP phosphodiesterase class II)